MPRPLDEVLGIKKTAAIHDLKAGDRVKVIVGVTAFSQGTEGEIKSLDEWGRPLVKLDIYQNLEFPFHHSYLEKVGVE